MQEQVYDPMAGSGPWMWAPVAGSSLVLGQEEEDHRDAHFLEVNHTGCCIGWHYDTFGPHGFQVLGLGVHQ